MDRITSVLNDRLAEIDSYLALLDEIEKQAQNGPPRIKGDTDIVISVSQQRILYSSVYLQLYNAVESTVSRCIDTITSTVVRDGTKPSELSAALRKEWVRYTARTHVDLRFENRLKHGLELCEHLINSLPIKEFEIEKGGGGNWDDQGIEKLSKRLGVSLQVNSVIRGAVKRPYKNDVGALSYVKARRNDLAHGLISFGECGNGVTVSELRELRTITGDYLSEVVNCFEQLLSESAHRIVD